MTSIEHYLQTGLAGCLRVLVAGESGVDATALPPRSKTRPGMAKCREGRPQAGGPVRDVVHLSTTSYLAESVGRGIGIGAPGPGFWLAALCRDAATGQWAVSRLWRKPW